MINEFSIDEIKTEKPGDSKKNVSFEPKHILGHNPILRASIEKIIKDKDKFRNQLSLMSKVNPEKIVRSETKKNRTSNTELLKINKEQDEFSIQFPEFFEIDLMYYNITLEMMNQNFFKRKKKLND
jgi:hypothetical protein